MNNSPLRMLAAALGLVFAASACERQTDAPRMDPPDQPTTTQGAAPVEPPPPTAEETATAPDTSRAGSIGEPVAGAERAFVAQAAASGLAEIEASRMVADRTTNEQIKDFAEQLEREHTSALGELQRIAVEKGIDLTASVEGEPREKLNQLNAASDDTLESSFLQDFGIDAHEKAIALFERQAREGQDADLRAYAERTLPKLREHLVMAQQLQEKQGGS